MSEEPKDPIASIAALVGLAEDASHLLQALTHPSYANERRGEPHNQRLEFLGDAVLGLCVSELLYQRFPDADEGLLTRMRAQLVNADALAAWARKIDLPAALRLGRGAVGAGLRESTNVLADAVEAILAAAYLDGGLEHARPVAGQIVETGLAALERMGARDPKSELQERLQALGEPAPTYEIIETSGPAHERWFRVRVLGAAGELAEGHGRSKRAAEQAAAGAALTVLGALAQGATDHGHEASFEDER
ncbi:MAG TPA: ribonuclease III [Polyangiaceae bacterium]|nr:ribonuclease III [Polyangiaceae bacterium]